MATWTEQEDAWQALNGLVRQLGLPITFVGKAWNYILDNSLIGRAGADVLLELWMQEQPEFDARFPAMKTLRQQKRAITPGDYIALERSYSMVMRQAGAPPGLFDRPQDFTRLIQSNVSPDELRTRMMEGYSKVKEAPPEVRAVFKSYFGIEGDTNLALYFMEPIRSQETLLLNARAAAAGGALKAQGFDVGLKVAKQLAHVGVGYEETMANMERVVEMRALFERGLYETSIGSAPTVTTSPGTPSDPNRQNQHPIWGGPQPTTSSKYNEAEEHAVQYAFGVDARILEEGRRRLEQRLGDFGQGQLGGAFVNRDLETGLGAAE